MLIDSKNTEDNQKRICDNPISWRYPVGELYQFVTTYFKAHGVDGKISLHISNNDMQVKN